MNGRFERELAAHAFSWLLAGNAAGVLMAALLLFPALGAALAPLTYGRWAAVHIDAQIYGFCSLPLLGLLFHLYSPPHEHPRLVFWVLRVWSGALAFLAVSSLTGHSSGKVFAEWTGAARWVFGSALVLAAVALVSAYARRLQLFRRGGLAASRASLVVLGCGLAALLPAPAGLLLAASPSVYPPIDPGSGGATSGNTLASVLGVALLLALSPFLAGLRPRDGGRFSLLVAAALAGHFLFVGLLGSGDHRQAEPLQQAALWSSLIWLPLLWEHLRRFPWPRSCRPWVLAMGAWGLVLALTGLLAGLPGVAARIKYTNFLVGHVHAAVAGLVTAWLFVLLAVVGRARGLPPAALGAFADLPAFIAWQAGSVLHIGALLALGWAEGRSPGLLWSGAPAVAWAYGLRLAGGLAMTFASWRWLRSALLTVHLEPMEEMPHASADPRLLPVGRLG